MIILHRHLSKFNLFETNYQVHMSQIIPCSSLCWMLCQCHNSWNKKQTLFLKVGRRAPYKCFKFAMIWNIHDCSSSHPTQILEYRKHVLQKLEISYKRTKVEKVLKTVRSKIHEFKNSNDVFKTAEIANGQNSYKANNKRKQRKTSILEKHHNSH